MNIIDEWPDTLNSTSNEDCYFLRDLCTQKNPKKILEIGTLVGKSAYALAYGSTCEVHTVDQNKDRFVYHEGYERIIRYPETTSIDFWRRGIDGFDFVFVDGWLKQEDVENIFERTLDTFWFVCHDYRPHDKGEEVVKRMLREGMKRDYDFDISEGGECCALVKYVLNAEKQ